MARHIISLHEKLPHKESLTLVFQHHTAMFVAIILVPVFLGMNPPNVSLMNGIGTTLIFGVTYEGGKLYKAIQDKNDERKIGKLWFNQN
jgi:xanthine/uracil permease